MPGALEDRGGRSAPVGGGLLSRLPLGQQGDPPLSGGARCVAAQQSVAPLRTDPGGDLSGLDVLVPGVGHVGFDEDQAVADHPLPVLRDLVGEVVVHVDDPGVALGTHPPGAALPAHRGEPGGLVGRESAQPGPVAAGLDHAGGLFELGPGGGRFDVPLREEVPAVEESHRAGRLRNGVHLAVEDALLPLPRHVAVAQFVGTVLAQVRQAVDQHEAGKLVVLDLRQVGRVPGRQRGVHLLVAARHVLGDGLHLDLDVGVRAVPQVDGLLHRHPGPEDELDLLAAARGCLFGGAGGSDGLAAGGQRGGCGERRGRPGAPPENGSP